MLFLSSSYVGSRLEKTSWSGYLFCLRFSSTRYDVKKKVSIRRPKAFIHGFFFLEQAAGGHTDAFCKMPVGRLPDAAQLSGHFDGESSSVRHPEKKLKIGGETPSGGKESYKTNEEWMARNRTLKMRILGHPRIEGSGNPCAVC